jgi:uncharacterized membrane protein YfcA/rhodanese-related sulfurtransferase
VAGRPCAEGTQYPLIRQPRLDPAALRKWLDQPDAPRVIDVRTPAEFETAHIPGSYNVPLHLLQEHSVEIAGHLDQDIALVCRCGMRAAQAEQTLAGTGLPNVHLLDGGITAWQHHAAPVTLGRARWDIERQVRLVAGTLVFVAAMGGLLLPGLQQAAIAASLFVVAVTSAVTLIPHARAGRVQWRTGLVFGSAGLAGAYAGGRLAGYVPAALLLAGFGLLIAAAAVTMIRSCRRPLQGTSRAGRLPVLLGLGAAVGLVTGMVGAGGRFVIVPVLVLLAGLSMTTAVGTSLLVVTMQSSAGLLGHLQHVLIEQATAIVRHALAGTSTGRIALAGGIIALALAAARHVQSCWAVTKAGRPNDGRPRPARQQSLVDSAPGTSG